MTLPPAEGMSRAAMIKEIRRLRGIEVIVTENFEQLRVAYSVLEIAHEALGEHLAELESDAAETVASAERHATERIAAAEREAAAKVAAAEREAARLKEEAEIPFRRALEALAKYRSGGVSVAVSGGEVSMPEERGGVSLVELEAEFRGVPASIAPLSRWTRAVRTVRRWLRLG